MASLSHLVDLNTDWNTECFLVWISNGLVLEWFVIALTSCRYGPSPKPDHWRTKQRGTIRVFQPPLCKGDGKIAMLVYVF